MAETLRHLTERPDDTAQGHADDLLSHVLAQVRLTGGRVQSRVVAGRESVTLAGGGAHVVVVKTGALHVQDGRDARFVVAAGALLMLAHGPEGVHLAAAQPDTELVVCSFWFDPDSLRGMVFALPRCLHIAPEIAAEWIGGLVHFAMIETDDVQPGAALMISRIIDLMVIRALRSWVHQGNATGWLGALTDPRIARALKVIHERPLQRWSIEALAEQAGMSRSSFCERFTTLVGRAPLRYQNEWRLGLARDMLARGDTRVGEIGLRIGYGSEAAFSRAYRQLFGHPPRADRR